VNTREEHLKKIHADEEALQKQEARRKLFDEKDKKPINNILGQIMTLVESKRDGTAKIRTAAYHLHRLLQIHKEYELGSKEKAVAMADLGKEIMEDFISLRKQPKFPKASPEVFDAAISALSKEKVNPAVTCLLRDFYVDKVGYINTYGAKIGAAGLIGAEVGFAAGKLVAATGKKYLVVRPSAHTSLGVGAFFSTSHTTGKSKMNNSILHVSTERMGMPFDTFLASKSKVVEMYPGDGPQTEDRVLAIGVRIGSMGVATEFKLFPLPGRDFKYLRTKLGLVP